MEEDDYNEMCWLFVYDHPECWRMLGRRLLEEADNLAEDWQFYLDREREEAAESSPTHRASNVRSHSPTQCRRMWFRSKSAPWMAADRLVAR